MVQKIRWKRKQKITFQTFLSSVPARDYLFQNTPYKQQIEKAAKAIEEAEYVLIGAGAGLSAAAGLTYGGKRFTDNFSEFIDKYGMTDMYSAGFYPFPSEEARWGYWSKHVYINRIEPQAQPLYQKLRKLVKGKNYFVLTTNVDHQFQKAGFAEEQLFATQGDYGLIQCLRGCHPKTYDNTEMIKQMHQARKDCLVPSYMVPRCPVCGGPMTMNLRCDSYFVEDDAWHEAEERFGEFLEECQDKKTVLLELGIGFNTPTIVRFPFEKLAREKENMILIRLNAKEAVVPENLGQRAIGIQADMQQSIADLWHAVQKNKAESVRPGNTDNSNMQEQKAQGRTFASQEERLDYLLQEFKKDASEQDISSPYNRLGTKEVYEHKRRELRSLMNIRMPRKMDEDIVNVQDEFLKQEAREKGIVEWSAIKTVKEQYNSTHPYRDKLSIWQGDITRLSVGAIVNAANSQMLGCFVPCHGCIDNAIHSAAGIELRAECNCKMNQKRMQHGPWYEEPTGQAMLTKGYNLPAQYVIHTVGPIVRMRLTEKLRQDLRNCYENVLKCCMDNEIRSVAFCCISTGEFHFPNDEAAAIAVETVTSVLKEHEQQFDRIIFNVFKDADKEYYEHLL